MNILDLNDAQLSAQQRMKKYQARFQGEFNSPVNRMMIKQAWQKLTDEQREYLKQTQPEQFAEMEQRYGKR